MATMLRTYCDGCGIRDEWKLDTGRPAVLEKLAGRRVESAVAENLAKPEEFLEEGRVVLQDGGQATHLGLPLFTGARRRCVFEARSYIGWSLSPVASKFDSAVQPWDLAKFDLYEGSGQKLSPRAMRGSLPCGTMKARDAGPEKEILYGASCKLANGTASYRTRNRGTVQGVILVTGATGNVGRQFVLQLLRAGAAVRALTRNPDSAGLPDDVVRGDLPVPDTMDGVEAVFLVCPEAAPAFLDAVTARIAAKPVA